jgi:hypothetical protein
MRSDRGRIPVHGGTNEGGFIPVGVGRDVSNRRVRCIWAEHAEKDIRWGPGWLVEPGSQPHSVKVP